MSEEKSWLEVEMEESMVLLRKMLEELNNISPEHITGEDIHCLKNIYKTLYYIKSIKASMTK